MSSARTLPDLLATGQMSGGRFAAVLKPEHDAGPGLTGDTVRFISGHKREPPWLVRKRLGALRAFESAGPVGKWAPAELAEVPMPMLHCYSAQPRMHRPGGDGSGARRGLQELLGALDLPREEASYLGGVRAQVDGEIVYESLREEWARSGIVFVDASRGLAQHPGLFVPYFGSVVARDENRFTRLNAAVFSGGSFIYIPAGVKVAAPFKCFMHLQARNAGQFGRTLIVLGAKAEVTFIEACTSAARPEVSLHCSVGEFVVGRGARLNYIALQDWTPNVFNLAILRARVAEGGSVHWIDCNLGGRLTMKYPCALLEGEGASAEAVSIAVARTGQRHDSGAKMIHRAGRTSSMITSKSVSVGKGRAAYRGWVDMPASVDGCCNHTECDALLVDTASRADTYPAIHVRGRGNTAQHEASVSQLSADQVFYLRQRGLRESAARSLSVNGFVNDLVERFPLQYSVKIKRLIEMHMEGSVG